MNRPTMKAARAASARRQQSEQARVGHGTVTRTGKTIVAVWDTDVLGRPMPVGKNKETWTCPDVEQAKREFTDMIERWS